MAGKRSPIGHRPRNSPLRPHAGLEGVGGRLAPGGRVRPPYCILEASPFEVALSAPVPKGLPESVRRVTELYVGNFKDRRTYRPASAYSARKAIANTWISRFAFSLRKLTT